MRRVEKIAVAAPSHPDPHAAHRRRQRQVGQDPHLVQEADGEPREAVATAFVAGKPLAVEQEHAAPAPREVERGGRAPRTCSHDDDICVHHIDRSTA